MDVALIIPALNEAEALPHLAARIPDWVTERILVDNGSTDATANIAASLGFKVVREERRGYGAAVWTGIGASDASILAFAAADGSDPLEALDQLVAPLTSGAADFVFATRQAPPGVLTFPQRFGNRLACALIAVRWGANFADLGPFRALHRQTLKDLNMQDRGFGWTLEMQAKVAARNLRWQAIPLPYGSRVAGRSKISGTFGGTIRASRAILWTFCRLAFKRTI